LRKKGEAVVDSKYEGKKASRKALYGSDDDEGFDNGEEEEESETGGPNNESDEEEEEVYEGEFADLLGPAGTDEDSNQEEDEESQDEQSEDEDEEGEEELEDEEVEVAQKPSKKPTTKQEDERVMIKELKQAASADVEKGRDVKKQLVSHINFHCFSSSH